MLKATFERTWEEPVSDEEDAQVEEEFRFDPKRWERLPRGEKKARVSDRKPSKEELLAAVGKTVPDVIAHGLQLLFCGINPGLYTAAVGHHFARPGNRFWPALLKAGFTDRLLAPSEEGELLKRGYGITNLVARATASASELSNEEYAHGARILERKILRYKPKCVAFLGVGAYRAAFDRPQAVIGRQDERLGGAVIWALPNPSGLNAHYQLDDLARLFAELREAVARVE